MKQKLDKKNQIEYILHPNVYSVNFSFPEMKSYLRLLNYGKSWGFMVISYLTLTSAQTIFGLINLGVVVPMLNVLFGMNEATVEKPAFSLELDYFVASFNFYFTQIISNYGELNALIFICLIVVLSTTMTNLTGFVIAYIQAKFRIKSIKRLRNHFFESLLSFDLKYFSSSKKGDIITKGTSDIYIIESSINHAFNILIRDPIKIIFTFAALFYISAKLTFFTIVLLPIAGLLISFIIKSIQKRALNLQNKLGEMGIILDEFIGAIRIVKAFAAEGYIKKKTSENIDSYARLDFSIAKRLAVIPSISQVFGSVTLAMLMIQGGSMIFNESVELQAAEFIAFIVLFSQIISPVKNMASSFSNISKGMVSAKRVFEFIDQKSKIDYNPNGLTQKAIEDGLEFRNVSFKYDKQTILKNISFRLNKGDVLALVGPSGGGKSTISDLIPRFYDPNEGTILIDGHDVREWNLFSLRRMMGIVNQEAMLFNDTVYNNICFSTPNVTKEKVIEAAKIANAHDFIEKLENKYDTQIGDRGVKLSGGQKQRLSIARAILKNPPFLILDEATSALDSESEKLVQDALNNLMKNRTTLIIAHRLSTVKHADRILVIKEGTVIQQGKHGELVGQEGLYKKLTNLQSFTGHK